MAALPVLMRILFGDKRDDERAPMPASPFPGREPVDGPEHVLEFGPVEVPPHESRRVEVRHNSHDIKPPVGCAPFIGRRVDVEPMTAQHFTLDGIEANGRAQFIGNPVPLAVFASNAMDTIFDAVDCGSPMALVVTNTSDEPRVFAARIVGNVRAAR